MQKPKTHFKNHPLQIFFFNMNLGFRKNNGLIFLKTNNYRSDTERTPATMLHGSNLVYAYV